MKFGQEAIYFLRLASTNHKLLLVAVRPHICPFVQVDILLRPEPFVNSQAKTRLYKTLLNLYHGIILLHASSHN